MKLYPKYKETALQSGVNLSSGTVKCVLVTSGYTQSDAHQFLSDVTSGARLGISGALTSKTFTNGTFDAADPSVSITANGTIVAAIFYVDTGTESTSPLIAFDDKANDGTTALSRAVLTGDTVNVGLHASGLFDL